MRAWLNILVVDFPLLLLWIYYATPFWPAEFLLKNQLIGLWEFPCMLSVDFLLLLLIFSLYLYFLSFYLLCLLICSSLDWSYMGLCMLPGLGTVSFPRLRKFSAIISSNIFSAPSLFSFWDPYKTNISALYVVPGSLKFCPHFFSFFFLFPIQWQSFPLLYLLVC